MGPISSNVIPRAISSNCNKRMMPSLHYQALIMTFFCGRPLATPNSRFRSFFQEGFDGGRSFKADHLLKILRVLGRLMTPVNGPNHLPAIEWSGMDMVDPVNPDDINRLSS